VSKNDKSINVSQETESGSIAEPDESSDNELAGEDEGDNKGFVYHI
jgi:hypothetical protein